MFHALILFNLCIVGLELCFDWYDPLMVVVLMCYTLDDVASSALLYELHLTWPFHNYFMNGYIIMLKLDYDQCEGLYDIRVCVRLNSPN